MTELSYELENYINSHIDPEDDLLYELNRLTNVKILHPRMLAGHLQGKILRMLCLMVRPQTVLEIGTFTGYSAICLAQGLQPGGVVHTIEINDELSHISSAYFRKYEMDNTIIQHIGDARAVIPTLDMQFDMVFMDGEKSEYLEYYHLVFEKIKSGGYILADNILWSGKVLEEPESNDYFTRGIQQFNDYVRDDSRVEKVILPIRDGLMIIRKK